MPTAFEYRAAAIRLRNSADEADGISSAMWRVGNDHGVLGGRLQQVVDDAFVANALNADQLRQECDSLAEECDRRADACEQFADDMAAWEQRHASWSNRHRTWRFSRFEEGLDVPYPGPEPRRPVKPFDWIEI